MAFRIAASGIRGISRGNTSSRQRLGSLALFGLKAGAVVAFSAVIIGAFASMQAATAHIATSGRNGFEASLGLKPVTAASISRQSLRISKFSRLGEPSADDLRMASLTPEAVRKSHQRGEMRVAMVRAARQQAQVAAVARSAEDVASSVAMASADATTGSMLTALASTPMAANPGVNRRFDLILNDKVVETADLPESIPHPLLRPAAPAKPEPLREVAMVRPERPLPPSASSPVINPARGRTAIYEIEAGIVHMPNGEKLEAHSGIGKMRDNPAFVHVKMRGATPPSSYRLTMREALFHGVEALRLTPENGIKPHGRDGLLAHTYMLAKRGESNGCVVFREYPRFLAAFKRGEVNRMVVVPRLDGNAAQPAVAEGKTGSQKIRRTVADYFRNDA